MAHNVNSIAWAFEKPWHGLGVEVPGLMTSAEALEAGGLNFDVGLENLYLADGTEIEDRKATIRNDTGDVLGTVGARYQPIQNTTAFQFMDGVIGSGEAKYEVVGSLGQGETIWMLARIPGELRVGNTDDVIDKYITLYNNHNGKMAMKCHTTPIRVVCQNTLNLAVSRNAGNARSVSVRHTGDTLAKVADAREIIGFAQEDFNRLEVYANELASQQADRNWVDTYLETLFPDNPDAKFNTRTQNTRDKIINLFDQAETNNLKGIRHTKWAAYNAVTEYVDHNKGKVTSSNLASIWTGAGADRKTKALQLALAG